MADARITLAADLYVPCALGADIGTDHALLPRLLLQRGTCQRMILADISPKALRHARETVEKYHLEGRTELVCADGLEALREACGCVSIMGMGGRSVREILLRGQKKLRGATLVLSAHTEQALVRRTLQALDYRITREALCWDDGRFYLFWRAEPGKEALTEEEIRYGGLLWRSPSPLLSAYTAHRVAVAQARLSGLMSASTRDEATLAEARAALNFYQRQLDAISKEDEHADSSGCV